MSKIIVIGGCVLILVLTGCMPRPQGQNQAEGYTQNPQAYNQQAYNQPVNPNQPAPYLQPGRDGSDGASPWPGGPGGPDGTAVNYAPSGQMPSNLLGFQGQDGVLKDKAGAPLQLAGAPQGMHAVKSQAGYVFRASLSGGGPVQQQSRDFYMKLMPYFDAQPQVMGYLDDPSGRMSQVGFQATKNGAPVMGMMMVTQGGDGGAVATVMLESPQRFQQSMQAMMAAAQQP